MLFIKIRMFFSAYDWLFMEYERLVVHTRGPGQWSATKINSDPLTHCRVRANFSSLVTLWRQILFYIPQFIQGIEVFLFATFGTLESESLGRMIGLDRDAARKHYFLYLVKWPLGLYVTEPSDKLGIKQDPQYLITCIHVQIHLLENDLI